VADRPSGAAIQKLAAENGPLQMSLFDEVNFCEITHPTIP